MSKNIKTQGTTFMAFGKAVEVKESESFKRYIGIAPVKVLAVNPTKAELEKIYGRELEKEPVYTGKTNVENVGEVNQTRIDFIVETVADKYNNIEGVKSKITFFISDAVRVDATGRARVIDSYGNAAWATKEQVESHAQLMSNDGLKKLKIATDYRPAYIGEEELTLFLKTLYNLEAFTYENGEWKLKPDANQMTTRFDNIKNIANGNIAELKQIVAGAEGQKIRVLFGVRTVDGNLYQDIYNRAFMKANYNDTSKIADEIKRRKDAGGLATTEYDCSLNFREYTVVPTAFAPTAAATPTTGSEEMPW